LYDIYQERILEHYRHPKNFGPLVGVELRGAESNPLCGDHIEIGLHVAGEPPRIEEVHFQGDGCAISVASTSMLTQRLRGLPLSEAQALTRDDVMKMLGIPLSPVRIKCALTGFAALGRALHPELQGTEPADGAGTP
jgi:nitrogen fixation NifU-like protein